jgi:hypothetical protein
MFVDSLLHVGEPLLVESHAVIYFYTKAFEDIAREICNEIACATCSYRTKANRLAWAIHIFNPCDAI